MLMPIICLLDSFSPQKEKKKEKRKRERNHWGFSVI
jgi:hypothetical protein